MTGGQAPARTVIIGCGGGGTQHPHPFLPFFHVPPGLSAEDAWNPSSVRGCADPTHADPRYPGAGCMRADIHRRVDRAVDPPHPFAYNDDGSPAVVPGDAHQIWRFRCFVCRERNPKQEITRNKDRLQAAVDAARHADWAWVDTTAL